MARIINSSNPFDTYEQEQFSRSIKYEIEEQLRNQQKTVEIEYNRQFMIKVIKFFKLDYELGDTILNLIQPGDKENEILAINMLFGAIKENIKNDIIKEIKEGK